MSYQALGLFRQSHHHHALVVDEFGSILGLLTLFDLLGTLVTDPDAGPDSAAIVRREDGSYLLDAQLSFTEFADYFPLADAERQELTVYHTLGGFVLQQLGAVPRVGQHFTCPRWPVSSPARRASVNSADSGSMPSRAMPGTEATSAVT